MFHIFENNQDRRQFGGSAFIEIQYCRLSSNTKLKKIVSVNSIRNWVEDSLYIFVDDIDSFIASYGSIFNMGNYNKEKKGFVDVYGINYYTVFRLFFSMVKIKVIYKNFLLKSNLIF